MKTHLVRGLPQAGLVVLLSLAAAFAPWPAWAGMSFCNRTKGPIDAALAYRAVMEDNTEEWISEGWWRIEPGQCSRVYSAPLEQRFYFYYARALSANGKDDTPMEWSGKHDFCTDKKAFRVQGDNACAARKYIATGFREIDIGAKTRDYTLDFKDGR
jgi:uncharacterized membrane protein